jgi:hypothetical protein
MSRLETPTGTLELRKKLARAQQKQISNRFGMGIGALVIFSTVALLTIATADWIFELPTVLRALWFLLTVDKALLDFRCSSGYRKSTRSIRTASPDDDRL